MRTPIVAAIVLAFSLAAPTAAVPVASAQTPAVSMPRTPAPPGAEAYIISPKHGAKVHSPVTVVFGLKGMGVAPAGIKFDNTGHHHLLVDTDPPADMSAPLPATDKILHFGKGQTDRKSTRLNSSHVSISYA